MEILAHRPEEIVAAISAPTSHATIPLGSNALSSSIVGVHSASRACSDSAAFILLDNPYIPQKQGNHNPEEMFVPLQTTAITSSRDVNCTAMRENDESTPAASLFPPSKQTTIMYSCMGSAFPLPNWMSYPVPSLSTQLSTKTMASAWYSKDHSSSRDVSITLMPHNFPSPTNTCIGHPQQPPLSMPDRSLRGDDNKRIIAYPPDPEDSIIIIVIAPSFPFPSFMGSSEKHSDAPSRHRSCRHPIAIVDPSSSAREGRNNALEGRRTDQNERSNERSKERNERSKEHSKERNERSNERSNKRTKRVSK